jgi:hypothetical protein
VLWTHFLNFFQYCKLLFSIFIFRKLSYFILSSYYWLRVLIYFLLLGFFCLNNHIYTMFFQEAIWWMNLSIMILHNCLFLWIAKTQSFMRVQGFSPVDSSNLSLFYMFSLFFFLWYRSNDDCSTKGDCYWSRCCTVTTYGSHSLNQMLFVIRVVLIEIVSGCCNWQNSKLGWRKVIGGSEYQNVHKMSIVWDVMMYAWKHKDWVRNEYIYEKVQVIPDWGELF